MNSVRWGVHSDMGTPSSPALEEYLRSGMRCIQVFFGSPKSLSRGKLSESETKACLKLITENKVSFNSHFPYVFNMCDENLSMAPLQAEINRVAAIGGRVVLHTGSCTFACCSNRDLQKATQAKKATWNQDWRMGADTLIRHLSGLEYPENVDCPLLLEPPAGEGKKLGWCLEQVKYIFERCPRQVGLCLDTCHAFAAGLCEFKTMEQIDVLFEGLRDALGDLRRFKLIHLNDSEDPFGSMKDRHAILREGHIWSNQENGEGLIYLWLMAGQHDIAMVSECGTERDIEVMKWVERTIKEGAEEK